MLALEKVVEKEIRWGATAMQRVWARTASWRTVVRIARAGFLKDIACCIPPAFIFEQSHCQSSKALMPRRKRENQLGSGARNILPERKACIAGAAGFLDGCSGGDGWRPDQDGDRNGCGSHCGVLCYAQEVPGMKTRSVIAAVGFLLAALFVPAGMAAKEATVTLEVTGMS
jgi:hypothetical protein